MGESHPGRKAGQHLSFLRLYNSVSGSSLDRELAECAGSCQQNQPLRNHSSKRESWVLSSENDNDRTEP